MKSLVSTAIVVWACFVQLAWADATAPSALYGKSVRLSWNESVSLRFVDSGKKFGTRIKETAVFYVSSLGRTFSRRTNDETLSGIPQNGPRKFTAEAVDSETNGGRINPFSEIEFADNTMTALRYTGTASATRVLVNFDETFTSCTATVVHAKSGEGSSFFTGPTSGRKIERLSTEASDARCSVENGNALE